MVSEDADEFVDRGIGASTAILVVVTTVVLATAGLLALTHDSGAALTTVGAATESVAIAHGIPEQDDAIAQSPVAPRPQLVAYIVTSEAEAAQIRETLRLREMLSFEFPDYEDNERLKPPIVLVARTPDEAAAWKNELNWTAADAAVTIHDLTTR